MDKYEKYSDELFNLCQKYDDLSIALIVLNLRLSEHKISNEQFAIEYDELIKARAELGNKLKKLRENYENEKQSNQKI